MSTKTRGVAVSVGGLLWLVGVLILELTFDSSNDDLPVSFSILAVLAGVGVGWGCWTSASFLEDRVARFGLRSVSVCSFVLGTGFGLALVEDMFLGFLLSYFVGLFILPVAFLVLGFGVVKSAVYPAWAKWLPFAVSTVAFVTYLFHALARDVWDPSDAVWYTALGAGWVLLGLAIAGFRVSGESSAEPDRPMTAVR
jgi:hypothetical protein